MEANNSVKNRVITNKPLTDRQNLSNYHSQLPSISGGNYHQQLRVKSQGNNITGFLLLCGVFTPFMTMLIIIIVGWLTPGYRPVSDTISLMGITGRPYAWMLYDGYFVYGILMSFAAVGLYRRLFRLMVARTLALLIIIHAAGTILLAVFPDSFNSPLQHIIHDVASTISYLPLLACILITCRIAHRKKVLNALIIPGMIVIAVNLPMPFINILGFLKPVGGLLQRLMMTGSFLWLTSLFLLLYRKTPSALPECNYSSVLDSG